MRNTDYTNLGQKDRDNTKDQIARLSLAGLQRSTYAGVFEAVPSQRQTCWTCDLILDGYNRRLNITINRKADPTPAGDAVWRYRGRLTGLHPLFQRRAFDLTAQPGTGSALRLIGRLDLRVAVLCVSVLPCVGADGERRILCLLEVQRTSLGH
ncbi:hypothetical protein SAMN05421666_0593 [Roseovarius nanhaiticus]|uniref:Uncharacterized protein n=1 Tax=Roseovarius nanhaiticus TaxID=573024 RepID=A0A1N7EX85_9RHOB|nr:hypothetical protein SAMN05216208_1542 [Roseovarius nanhaiticus]SIR92680.1 hypothetical protein SAMN05421666_0593 [Roseovarius nanhaiticus]